MVNEITIIVHSIAEDGLPDMDNRDFTGKVAFLWDGYIVSGWPLDSVGYPGMWESADDALGGKFTGVTHWVEFPTPVWKLEHGA